jgi:REP element-mobilizing transposase RayT
MVGRYMVMPDHIHFFAAPNTEKAVKLSEFGGRWKGITRKSICSIGYPSFNWQPEFFDHLIRNERSYIEKLDYICRNPVRAQLVANTEDWPYQGEIYLLKW